MKILILFKHFVQHFSNMLDVGFQHDGIGLQTIQHVDQYVGNGLLEYTDGKLSFHAKLLKGRYTFFKKSHGQEKG